MNNFEEILEKYWGYTSFRGSQREAIDAIVNKKQDVFFLAPTSLRKKRSISTTSYLFRGYSYNYQSIDCSNAGSNSTPREFRYLNSNTKL